jgi:hypothetical protein
MPQFGEATIQFETDEKFRGVVSLMVNLNSLYLIGGRPPG